jgi:hypothetical protein
MEIAFFSNHPVFRTCNPKLYGVAQLSKRLTQLLVNRIQLELVLIYIIYFCIYTQYDFIFLI